MAKRPISRVGVVVEIPLESGRLAYGHYVFNDKLKGPLVNIFSVIANERLEVEELRTKPPLFPPIIAGMRALVRQGTWTIIGKLPIENFVYPGFLWSNLMVGDWDRKPVRTVWRYWNGTGWIELGAKVPRAYAGKEALVVWGYGNLAIRIETGRNPYGDVIAANVAED